MIRPLLPADVAAARDVSARAFEALDLRTGEAPHPQTPQAVARGELRISHLQRTDPDSAWVAESDGRLVGCSLALVRDGIWFLSLLMVDPACQGAGLGRQLLDAALTTATDRSWILSTVDPGALRRYQRAGFDLHPAYCARGSVDRTLIPAVQGIREGSYDDDHELVDAVALATRGAAVGPDLAVPAANGMRLLVSDTRAGRGFAVLRPGDVAWLAATTEDAARRLLWAAIAEAGDAVEVNWLTAGQQWAIDVSLEARLTLGGGASVCLRGQVLTGPYLPNGAFG